MTCPLCHATAAMLAHSCELARLLHHGERPSKLKHLIGDLARVHRNAVRLRQLAPTEQLYEMGAVHVKEESCPN